MILKHMINRKIAEFNFCVLEVLFLLPSEHQVNETQYDHSCDSSISFFTSRFIRFLARANSQCVCQTRNNEGFRFFCAYLLYVLVVFWSLRFTFCVMFELYVHCLTLQLWQDLNSALRQNSTFGIFLETKTTFLSLFQATQLITLTRALWTFIQHPSRQINTEITKLSFSSGFNRFRPMSQRTQAFSFLTNFEISSGCQGKFQNKKISWLIFWGDT